MPKQTAVADAESVTEEQSPLSKAIAGLKLRNIGPAFMGGRISDIAIHPSQPATWYLAVGSGGVWKTTNAGTTWEPIFDEQASYSIGCIAVDPQNPNTIWVGTGESVSGRHVAWGDGIYRSLDGGKTWVNMGLQHSEHIGTISIDPDDGDNILVAAEGPLWASGGQRGVFRTSDGGQTWDQALDIDDDTGVTCLVRSPSNPNVVLAAAYQRRRHVAVFAGGGPGSGIHKSTDGGVTWRLVDKGLPEGDMGKIGLAVTPADPDRVYATIEASAEERGFYYSSDTGESWEKRNQYISGGTGPHYYQEIFASPTDPDRVYQVDVFLHVTRDGGKTFGHLESSKNKHSDNHVVWIDPHNSDHLLVGTDAGLYETYDEGDTFRHFPNLPIAQFYRVAADNSEPFYNLLGGAQDLGTLYGPSRTTGVEGVRNQDWTVPLGADGYHAAFDPTDPDISYFEWQVGNVVRHNRRTMEITEIRPVPEPGDEPERWNWDCPIVVSPHDPARIYVASQRVWRSDDRGDSWKPISGDLTTARNRLEIETFGSVPGVSSMYDHMAMSYYSTISHMSESSVVEGLIYVGTDDGMVHVTSDGGESWVVAQRPPGLPAESFINNVKASAHDADVVFLAADDHKHGDFSPYLYRSDDRGRSWQLISGDLPEQTIIWSVEQDHVDPNLLFVGAEFGLHVTLDGGNTWHQMKGDVPTISFRDVKIHRRDDDLICGSFGRGIYILDDFDPLRHLAAAELEGEPCQFPVRRAWWYVPHLTAQAVGQPTLGSTSFKAPNPDFGAAFTYFVPDDIVGPTKRREKQEKEQRAEGNDVSVPSLEVLYDEHIAADPALVLVVRHQSGTPVRQLAAESTEGMHRTTWDLRMASPDPVKASEPDFVAPWERPTPGPLVTPGTYTVELAVLTGDEVQVMGERQSFEVQVIPQLGPDVGDDETAEFRLRTLELARRVFGLSSHIDRTRQRIDLVRRTLRQTASDQSAILADLELIHRRVEDCGRKLNGDPAREELSEPGHPTISSLISRTAFFHWRTTKAPTATQLMAVSRGETELTMASEAFETAVEQLDGLVEQLDSEGGTWTPR